MSTVFRSTKVLNVIAWMVLILGLVMVAYWAMFLVQRMPIGDIPILSESITAALALVTGYALMARRQWAVPFALVLAGMWGYGVIAGIGLVLQHGLDFDSPFGAMVDAILFPLVLLFSIWLAIVVWTQRDRFLVKHEVS